MHLRKPTERHEPMSHVRRLEAGGLRGLSSKQSVDFAVPNGMPGSGLTVLVGSNNAGKSTFLEALRVLAGDKAPAVSEGRRNRTFGDEITLRYELEDGRDRALRSVRPGGSETEWDPRSLPAGGLFVVPSRRAFDAYFGGGNDYYAERENYLKLELPALKTATIGNFTSRLFRVNRDPVKKRAFDDVMRRIVTTLPEWTIDQNDAGSHYLKFIWGRAGTDTEGRHTHSSDGLGEGIVSLFFLVDSLYDSQPGSMTVIDEPELSLHPQLQRRLRSVMSTFAADRQIVYATHSPYFISWDDIANGASVVRVFKDTRGTQTAIPQRRTLEKVAGLAASDTGNPHVLGLDAAEVFFLTDGVILVEGQDDKVFMPKVLAQLGISLDASYFGWGVGGAPKMTFFARLLDEMGYRRVLGLLDNDHESTAQRLRRDYPSFRFDCIPADDVRYKPERGAVAGKRGLLDESLVLRPELETATRDIFIRAQSYFNYDEQPRVV